MAIIRLKDVEKVYKTRDIETIALENINLEIEEGEFISIIGPSGCGKSTLLNIIGLLDKASKGIVEIAGEKMENMNDSRLSDFRNRNIGFIFQSFHLIPSLNVMENVALPLIYRKGISYQQRQKAIKNVLEKLELTHRMKHYPGQLSGGQSQRVAIARAIIGNPKIILADEPTGNLDSIMSREVMDILHKLNREEGRTIVLVTHNESQARETDRIIRLFDGQQVM